MQNSLPTHKFLWWKIQNLQIALQFFQTEPKSHRMLFIFVVALIQALSSFYPLFPKFFILEGILKVVLAENVSNSRSRVSTKNETFYKVTKWTVWKSPNLN